VRNCRHTKPRPKSKNVVIVCKEKTIYWGFLVNSEIRPFVQRQRELLACQISIKQSDYPTILEYDSYIDCTQLYSFSEQDLENPGFLKATTKEEIKRVIRESLLLEERYQQLILGS